jgi:hypothetical protein
MSNKKLFFGDDIMRRLERGGREKETQSDRSETYKAAWYTQPKPQLLYAHRRLKCVGYKFCLLTRCALARGIDAEALDVWDRRKARNRCMFLTTAARRSTSSFIASAISASRRSIRDAVLSFGSLSIRSGCFASSIIGRPCTRYHAQ